MRWNADSISKTITDLDFCRPNGQYIRVPMEALCSAKKGTLEFAASEEKGEAYTIEFSQLIEDIKVAWEKAWEDFASGIN